MEKIMDYDSEVFNEVLAATKAGKITSWYAEYTLYLYHRGLLTLLEVLDRINDKALQIDDEEAEAFLREYAPQYNETKIKSHTVA
jgi:hypothetical protein